MGCAVPSWVSFLRVPVRVVDGYRKSESAVLLVHLLSGIAKHLSRNEFEEQTLTLIGFSDLYWI